MKTNGVYIYCITDIPGAMIHLEKGGVENKEGELFTVAFNDLLAIVSEAEIKQYRPTRKNTLVHEMNIEKIMRMGRVLPFRFGVVAKNTEEIVKMLEKQYAAFKALLKSVDNRIEVGVKVSFSDINDTLKSIGEQHPVINQLRKQKADISRDQNMIIGIGKMIEQELNEISIKCKDTIFAKLSGFAEKSNISENLSNEMVLNASFLINKDKENEFDRLVYELDEKYEGKLIFKCVAPLPPYSFVKL